jgi:hypothetical protein
VTGSPGAVSAIVSSSSCDGSPFSLVAEVAESSSGGKVSLAHTGAQFPAGGECSYTLKVQGSVASSDGVVPSDAKLYSFVADSSAADRVVVLTSKYYHSPVVYVRQDDGSFTLRVPKADFTWTAGNCLLQRVPTSAQLRAVACKKIGVVDPNFYVLALSAADWTLSESTGQVAKLGAFPSVMDSTYWADVNGTLVGATPQVNAVVLSKGGKFARDDNGAISFTPTVGSQVLVAAGVGSVKLFIGW